MHYIKQFRLRIRMMMRLLILAFIHNLWIVNSIPYLGPRVDIEPTKSEGDVSEEYDKNNVYQINFTSIGDWGCYQLGDPYRKYQYKVGYAMGERCCDNECEFVINVGDNFYPNVSSKIDQVLWNANFENVYHDHSLMIPWYSILGNHDYVSHPEQQLLYISQNYNRWQLPSRYYNVTTYRDDFPMKLNFIFLDTSPCIKKYRKMDKDVNISQNDINNSNSIKNEFIDNILSQNCSEQYEWFKNTIKWYVEMDEKIVVVGHHPVYQIDFDSGNINFIELFQKYDSHIILYISGHKHRLERYHIKHSSTEFMISGAGCQYDNSMNMNLFYENENELILEDKIHKTIYENATLGFSSHTVKFDNYTNKISITNTFYDMNNEEMYSFDI
jgi:tartrate-resistant acid phosphatase type 5